MLTGIMVGTWLTLHLARKAGIPQETTITAAVWGVVFGLVGARLSHVLDNLDTYIDNPAKILAIHGGGLGVCPSNTSLASKKAKDGLIAASEIRRSRVTQTRS